MSAVIGKAARERKRSSPDLTSLTFSLYPLSGRGPVPRTATALEMANANH